MARDLVGLRDRRGLALLGVASRGGRRGRHAVEGQGKGKEKEKQEPKDKDKKDEPKKKPPPLPLKSDRTIEFTTDEGTWVSLDVSPDGKTIVFDLLGDLYTVGIEGGDAKAITTGPAFDSSAAVFARRQVDRIRQRPRRRREPVDRREGRLGRPAASKDKQSLFVSPSWTPDGDYVLVSRQPQQPWGAFDLWMYHVRGGSGIAITKGKTKPDATGDDYVHSVGAVASRDGKHVYYTKRNKLFNAYNNLNFPLSQVVRRDRTTGDEDTITGAPGSAFRPLLSPDGSKLVFGTRVDNQTGLRIRDLATGEERWLKLPVQRDEQESRFTRDLIPGCAFTPDGKFVLAVYGGKIHRLDVADQRRHGDPDLGASVAAGRLAAQFSDPGRRRTRAGAVDSGAGAFARRQASGFLGADEALHARPA